MSLRNQIYIHILISSLCILFLGGSIAIWQAHNAVNREVDSSISLAVQLIKFGLSQANVNEADWLHGFNSLKKTRHLNIELQAPSGEILSLSHKNKKSIHQEQPPQWFINLVGGKHTKTEHAITTFDGKQFTLVIQANPLDEVSEVWQESMAFFVSLLLLALLTFLAVHFAFNKALNSIVVIVNALKTIETGDYQQKLPEFSTQEFDSIAKAINHVTDELNKAQQENRALTQHTLEIQEDERRRLAQDLHDELGQSLTAVKVMAVTAAHKNADINQITQAIASICDHMMCVVRSMMRQLHPLVLTELGLKASIKDLISHWASRHPEIKITFNCPDEVDAIGQKITIQVFRVVQECMTNIVRHSEAKQAMITLQIEHHLQQLKLEVFDNGRGYTSSQKTTGFGLLGIKERVNSLGGTVTIKNQVQQGLKITVNIPLI
jgi:two-component system, NarL family, sensor histidine kinase UhpB